MAHYNALIHRQDDSCYGVSFPDLPGCIGASDVSIDDAIENATQSLALHVEGMMEDKFEVPTPSSLESLRQDADFNELAKDATIVQIPLKVSLGKAVRVNVSFDENTLELIDSEAKARRMTRSSFLAKAAKNMVA